MHLWRFVEYPSCRTHLFAQNRFHKRPGQPWDFPLARAGTCQVLLMGGLWPVQRRLRCAHERDLRAQGRLRCAHEKDLRVQGRLRCAHEQDLPAHGRALRVHGRAGPLYGLSMY